MNPLYYISSFTLYILLGICIGVCILFFIKPSNYIQDLAKDIKADLNIDISKTK